MTGRERLNNIINSKPTDRISWTTIADDTTRSNMPKKLKEMPLLDFYRYIGCDILQFGNYGLQESAQVKYPCNLVIPELEHEEYIDSSGVRVIKRKSQWGELTSALKNFHPVKYPVESIEGINILKHIWLNSYYKKIDDNKNGSYQKNIKEIGESGIYVPTIEPSPVQLLLEYEMGVENFYYLLHDYPEEVEELIAIIHKCRMQQYRIIASTMPYDMIIPVENTSTALISPDLYRKYSMPHIRDFVNIMHEHGKKAVIHMCGHLNNLLMDIKETGLDGIHALTPKPIGNTDFERALDVLGEKLIIVGCLDSTVFQKKDVTTREIWGYMDKTITPRLRSANFILWAVADGIPTSIERFLAVREWIEKNGYK